MVEAEVVYTTEAELAYAAVDDFTRTRDEVYSAGEGARVLPRGSTIIIEGEWVGDFDGRLTGCHREEIAGDASSFGVGAFNGDGLS